MNIPLLLLQWFWLVTCGYLQWGIAASAQIHHNAVSPLHKVSIWICCNNVMDIVVICIRGEKVPVSSSNSFPKFFIWLRDGGSVVHRWVVYYSSHNPSKNCTLKDYVCACACACALHGCVCPGPFVHFSNVAVYMPLLKWVKCACVCVCVCACMKHQMHIKKVAWLLISITLIIIDV